jgi:hypothetical protein
MLIDALIFQEDCWLATGNWLIDRFHLWCGLPFLWVVVYWLLITLLAIVFFLKKRNWKLLALIVLLGLGLWLVFRILLALLFVKEGLLQQSEIGEEIKFILLRPIDIYKIHFDSFI